MGAEPTSVCGCPGVGLLPHLLLGEAKLLVSATRPPSPTPDSSLLIWANAGVCLEAGASTEPLLRLPWAHPGGHP